MLQALFEIYKGTTKYVLPAIQIYLDGDDPALFSVRAHVVEALNSVLPPGRKQWDRNQLFLFISAFTSADRSDASADCTWTRPQSEMQNLLLRGCVMLANQKEVLCNLLSEEMEKVLDFNRMLRRKNTDAAKAITNDASDWAAEIAEVEATYTTLGDARKAAVAKLPQPWRWLARATWHPQRSVADRALKAHDAVADSLSGVAAVPNKIRAKNEFLKTLLLSAHALEQGGLSTMEVREVLQAHGIPLQDIDQVLRIGPSQ